MKYVFILVWALIMGILAILIPLSVMASRDSQILAMRHDFERAVIEINDNRQDQCQESSEECVSDTDPSAYFSGLLSSHLTARDTLLREKHIVFVGSWTTGASHGPGGFTNPGTNGLYIPFRPCLLDSLPVFVRERLCRSRGPAGEHRSLAGSFYIHEHRNKSRCSKEEFLAIRTRSRPAYHCPSSSRCGRLLPRSRG